MLQDLNIRGIFSGFLGHTKRNFQHDSNSKGNGIKNKQKRLYQAKEFMYDKKHIKISNF